MPRSEDETIRLLLGDESLPEEVKAPVLQAQIARLKAMLESQRPGWQEEIHDGVVVHEHRDPLGTVPVVQHGEIE